MRLRGNIILLIVLALAGCQVIPENERLIEMPVIVSGDVHPHVLIEYTGFRCVNCPTATELAQSLVQLYDTQLIVVAMHPASNPFTQGAKKFDYTCPEADVYYTFMHGTQTTPFPIGNIDFTPVEGTYLFEPNMWAAQLSRVMNDSTSISLAVEAEVDTLTREVDIRTRWFADKAMPCRLVIWFVEDSVLGAQAMPDGTNNMAYYHRHMFRGGDSDNPWGRIVDIGEKEEMNRSTATLPDKCGWRNCHIVAVLMDKEDYHILNATQTNIKRKE